MPRKQPLPKREIEIGRRLRQARTEQKCSRAYLAHALGIHPSVLKRIELGRAPLRYGLAREIFLRLDANPVWMATGKGERRPSVILPTQRGLRLEENAAFSAVFDHLLTSVLAPERAGVKAAPKTTVGGFDVGESRWTWEQHISERLRDWLAHLPNQYVAGFSEALVEAGEKLLPQYPFDTWETILKRRQLLAQSKHDTAVWLAELKRRKEVLTDAETSARNVGVSAQLPKLLERLRKATAAPGRKSELAKALARSLGRDIPLASVSRWLSGEREPGGEIALRLLHWVESQEPTK